MQMPSPKALSRFEFEFKAFAGRSINVEDSLPAKASLTIFLLRCLDAPAQLRCLAFGINKRPLNDTFETDCIQHHKTRLPALLTP